MASGKWASLMAALGVCIWANVALGAAVEATKDGVTVHDKADKSGAVLVTLKKGDSLPAGERKGLYWEVTTKDGKKGFVSILTVKQKASESEVAEAVQAAMKNGRPNSKEADIRSRSAVMGVRGLDSGSDSDFAGNARPNLRAVFAMEDLSIDPRAVATIGQDVMDELVKRSEQSAKK